MSKNKSRYKNCRGPGIYKIRVKGHLQDRWKDWLECLTLTREDEGTTSLYCNLPDQTALHSVLQKIRDLNLQLISFEMIEEETDQKDVSP